MLGGGGMKTSLLLERKLGSKPLLREIWPVENVQIGEQRAQRSLGIFEETRGEVSSTTPLPNRSASTNMYTSKLAYPLQTASRITFPPQILLLHVRDYIIILHQPNPLPFHSISPDLLIKFPPSFMKIYNSYDRLLERERNL